MPQRFQPVPPGTDANQANSIINKNFAELDNESVTKLFYNNEGNTGMIQGQLPDDLGSGVLLKDSAGRNSIAMYVSNTGQPTLKVAKTGEDAVTGSDDELIFNSSQNVLKVAKILTGSIALSFAAIGAAGSDTTFSDNSTNTLTMPHGLSTVPAILPYLYDAGSGLYAPAANGSLLLLPGWVATNPSVRFQGTTVGSMATMYLLVNVDGTNVTVRGVRSGWQRSGVDVVATTFPTIQLKVYCLQETAN